MISPFAGFTIVVVASKTLGINTLKELIEHAKKNPGAQLRLGRHRQLAASGRRVFRAGHRREDDPRALSQHRPVRSGPDRRHGAARLPVVSEHRGAAAGQGRDPAGRRRRQAHSARCPTRRPRPKRACRNTRSTAGSRCSPPPARRSRSCERLNKELNAALNDPQVKAGFEKAGAECRSMPLEQVEEVPRRRDRQVSRHHHQGRHREDRIGRPAGAAETLERNERVLIAGAGPVGLVAGAQLLRAGVPVTVFEEGATYRSSPAPRRSIRRRSTCCDELGAAEPLIAQGLKAPTFQYRTKKHGLLAEFDFAAIADATGHPYRVQSEQSKLTRILSSRCAAIRTSRWSSAARCRA